MPANLIIHAPVALTIPVDFLRKPIMACRPIPTNPVTITISIVTERINPPSPAMNAPSPTTVNHATNGNTAAAVQSTDAAD